MSANKDIAWSYFAAVTDGRIDDAYNSLADDGTWWDNRGRSTGPMSAVKDALHKTFAVVPMRFTLVNSFEDGDVVVLEVESHADLPNGGKYNNVYAFFLTIADGKIRHVREYDDTSEGGSLPPDVLALFYEES